MQHSAEEQGLAALALQTLLAVIRRLGQHTLLAYFVMHVAAVLQAALGDSWMCTMRCSSAQRLRIAVGGFLRFDSPLIVLFLDPFNR